MNKAFVFDFDDTLANTACHVLVRDADGNPIKSLSPAQFNTYKLLEGETFDFCEFRDEIFIHEANATWLMALAQEVYNENHKVFILTARDNVVADAICIWLMKHGIEATDIHCVGGTKESIAENKKKVLLDIVNAFDKCYFYDDSEENVNIYQHEKLRSYLV
jgi:phosphoserine phosphatase